MKIGDLILWKQEVLRAFLIPSEELKGYSEHIGLIFEERHRDGHEVYRIIWITSDRGDSYIEEVFKTDINNWFDVISKS
jgi:hypothetical protein